MRQQLGVSSFQCSGDVLWAGAGWIAVFRMNPCHTRTPTKVHEGCPGDSSSGTSSRRQATVESDSLSGIGGPLPDAKAGVLSDKCGSVKESRGAGTRSCASPRLARQQRGGQRDQRRKLASTCAEVRTGSVWAAAPPFAHAGR